MNRPINVVRALVIPVVIVALSVEIASAGQVVNRDAPTARVVDVNALHSTALGGGENPPGCDELRFFERTITTDARNAYSVFAADVDGDGDIDILSASWKDDKIAWYENWDGLGKFTPQQVISTEADGPRSVFAADLDGDGDIDVLSASLGDGKIAWYENILDHGSFGPQRIITTGAIGAISVFAADVDGDGDIDVLSASIFDDKIAWYENTDGKGTFTSARVITESAGTSVAIFVVDLDGDGDGDVLSASSGSNRILWYENIDGSGTFGEERVITTIAHGASSVFAADVDGDGDMDVLSASWADDTVAWYENLDGLGTFGSQQIITTQAATANSVFAVDLDGDGDVDVLSASLGDNKIAWYENIDGLGTFGQQHTITTGARSAASVFAADLDNDGDADVISASESDHTIAWYENGSDCNGNGINDGCELADGSVPDCNDNDRPDECDIAERDSSDCNNNGIPDDCDLETLDCNGNGYSDECEIADGVSPDCDGNGEIDECDISNGLKPDCNSNSIPDECDVAGGASLDCNTNGIPDECDLDTLDCDGNGQVDECEVIAALFPDCNGNGIHDGCELAKGLTPDCNANSTPDECEIADGSTPDCNVNGIPDGCELADESALDCNDNHRPDECDITEGVSLDCNDNGVPDECDLDTLDCDGNGEVDECEFADGLFPDCNGNGIFDACDLLSDRHVISDDVRGARSVFAADLDGDGDTDVLSASSWEDKIAWYENTDGHGAFGLSRIITLNTDGASSVFAADIDGDGDIDVLSASVFDGKIAWYENVDGLGTFSPQRVITTEADGARSVFAADLDGDGDTDIISASTYDGKIAWYENTDGLGKFGSEQVITKTAFDAAAVFAADLDGDGDLDVLSASMANDTIAWYENTDGRGTFSSPRIITKNARQASSVFALDLDGDGDIDVLSASRGDDTIAWYENEDGRGNFGPQRTITSDARMARSVFASDLDGDGDADVVSASSRKIEWYENTDGLGAFGASRILTNEVSSANSVFAADLDGEGSLDVLSASWNDRTIAWYGNIFASQDCNDNGVPDECDIAEETSGDCNNNGRPDECDFDESDADCNDNGQLDTCELADGLIPDCNANGIPDTCDLETHDCDGNGQVDECELADGLTSDCNSNDRPDVCDFDPFSADENRTVIDPRADYVRSVFATDLDGDGDVDVILASDGNDGIAWYENTDGRGTFYLKRTITSDEHGADSLFAADLDGDGDVDVLSASFHDNKIAWYENIDGLGTFGAPHVIPIQDHEATSITAADLDGDGDMDVLSALENSGEIVWFENTDGLGNFGPQLIITTQAEGAQSVVAADVDGDGDIDVLSASAYDDKIAWYENVDGHGNFGSQKIINANAEYATSVLAVDIDGDGDIDVLSTSESANGLVWYENTDGLGTFAPPKTIDPLDNGPASVLTVDLDRDGDLDVVASFEYGAWIVWFENTDGLGAFGPTRVVTESVYGATAIFAADFDGDRDQDILVASDCGYLITWYENTLVSPDCNGNDVPDECDLADLTSTDCNNNGQPDECESDGDGDGDGIPDVCDLCPDSSYVESIIINGCDAGVDNVLFDDGCTMVDAIDACETNARNHGALTSCITDVANTWKRQGFITGREFGAMISCAGSGQSTKNTLRGASRTDARKN